MRHVCVGLHYVKNVCRVLGSISVGFCGTDANQREMGVALEQKYTFTASEMPTFGFSQHQM